MTLVIGALTIGLILSVLALGIYISFRIFDFPDITAEGSITLGAAVAADVAGGRRQSARRNDCGVLRRHGGGRAHRGPAYEVQDQRSRCRASLS